MFANFTPDMYIVRPNEADAGHARQKILFILDSDSNTNQSENCLFTLLLFTVRGCQHLQPFVRSLSCGFKNVLVEQFELKLPEDRHSNWMYDLHRVLYALIKFATAVRFWAKNGLLGFGLRDRVRSDVSGILTFKN
ncbi:unnamed protein product [Sphenostylis stenocarpa]|uniref:Uncharacterized protein n=1 Tax=Sphenostylis stenocarpa TaxID=92480 RepID=A0AA86VE14_9FABA|nr:unnamed protein product [Sphenostylis stenocarpa]